MPNNLVLPSTSKSSSRAASSSSKAMRSRGHSAPLSHTPALVTLVLGKASRVFAAFVSFHFLQDRVALPQYLFFVTLGAAATLLALQRPWTGKRIGAKRGRRVILAGGFLAATLYIWTAGLRSAGPLRTLLVDGAELPLIYLFAVLTRRELPERRKTRGALCMLLAYVLLIWDASGHVPDVREIEHSRFGQRAEDMVGRLAHGRAWGNHAHQKVRGLGGGGAARHDQHNNNHKDELVGGFGIDEDEMLQGGGRRAAPRNDGRRRLLTTFRPRVKGPGGVRDAFVEGTALRCEVGVVLVLVASVLVQAGRGFSRRLATELGGAKRHFALSMAGAVGWMSPLALLSWASTSTGAVLSLQAIGGVTRMRVTWGHTLGFFAVGFLWLVLPFYTRAVVSTAVSSRTMMQTAVAVPFGMAVAVVAVAGGEASAGGLSWVLLAAFLLECVGVSLMMAGGVKRGLSELPIDTAPPVGAAGNGSGHGVSTGAGGANGAGAGANGAAQTGGTGPHNSTINASHAPVAGGGPSRREAAAAAAAGVTAGQAGAGGTTHGGLGNGVVKASDADLR